MARRSAVLLIHQTFAGIAIGAFFLTAGQSCKRGDQPIPADKTAPPIDSRPPASFVGSQSCSECHLGEMQEWQGSDHHLAMQPANETTVLGDFSDVSFSHFGVETRFFKEGDRFFVRTPDSQGEPAKYPIDYTFGHYPLQQYLIKFSGGRYQALNICWDSAQRKKEDSAGFIFTRTRRSHRTMSCTGRGSTSIGTTCVPTATRPI